jgi:hypothetical protein
VNWTQNKGSTLRYQNIMSTGALREHGPQPLAHMISIQDTNSMAGMLNSSRRCTRAAEALRQEVIKILAFSAAIPNFSAGDLRDGEGGEMRDAGIP